MATSTLLPPRQLRFPHLRLALGIAGSAFFGLLLGALGVALFATQFLGYKVATIQSYSMEPTLRRGDLIVTRPVDISEVNKGDIVLFEEGLKTRILVAHRVDGVFNITTNVTDSKTGKTSTSSTKMLRTKGDANAQADADPVGVDRFRGDLLLTIHGAGYLANGLPLQQALFLLAAVTAVMWGAYELARHRHRRASAVDQASPDGGVTRDL